MFSSKVNDLKMIYVGLLIVSIRWIGLSTNDRPKFRCVVGLAVVAWVPEVRPSWFAFFFRLTAKITGTWGKMWRVFDDSWWFSATWECGKLCWCCVQYDYESCLVFLFEIDILFVGIMNVLFLSHIPKKNTKPTLLQQQQHCSTERHPWW